MGGEGVLEESPDGCFKYAPSLVFVVKLSLPGVPGRKGDYADLDMFDAAENAGRKSAFWLDGISITN